MSKASKAFDASIEDATTLLQLFDEVHKNSPDRAEVLNRAGLVMALTAWETYVEDRLNEAVQIRLRAVAGSSIGHFVGHKLADELKRLHNPTPEKVKQLCMDFLEVDVDPLPKVISVILNGYCTRSRWFPGDREGI